MWHWPWAAVCANPLYAIYLLVSASHGRTTSAMDTTTKTVASVTAPVLINTKVSALKTSISAFVCRFEKKIII